MRETTQRRSSAETFSPLQEQGDMKELGLWHGEETARDHATAIISRDLLVLQEQGDMKELGLWHGEETRRETVATAIIRPSRRYRSKET